MDSETVPKILFAYTLILVVVVVAVGLSIAGIVLLVTCESTQTIGPFGGTTIGCTYPFQAYGESFLYVAGIVATLALFPVDYILRVRAKPHYWDPLPVVVVVAVLLTAAFAAALLIL